MSFSDVRERKNAVEKVDIRFVENKSRRRR